MGEKLGTRVRLLRAQQGLTIDQVAYRAGVHRSTIANVERGRFTPRADTLGRIAGALGAPARELMELLE